MLQSGKRKVAVVDSNGSVLVAGAFKYAAIMLYLVMWQRHGSFITLPCPVPCQWQTKNDSLSVSWNNTRRKSTLRSTVALCALSSSDWAEICPLAKCICWVWEADSLIALAEGRILQWLIPECCEAFDLLRRSEVSFYRNSRTNRVVKEELHFHFIS